MFFEIEMMINFNKQESVEKITIENNERNIRLSITIVVIIDKTFLKVFVHSKMTVSNIVT